MDKIEQAQQVVRLHNAFKILDAKLEFTRDGRFKDEFVLVYTQGKISEYSPNIELTENDIMVLRSLWEERRRDIEIKLDKLLGEDKSV